MKTLNENDPIKIAYNWIGPRGPIVNTELPNIMSITNVSVGTKIERGNYFWADDIYWRIFMHTGNHPLSPSYHMDEDIDEIFIYPFTLAWRVNFQNYFLFGNGILEFSYTPEHIIHQVRHHNGFILLDCSAEAWVQESHLQVLHSYFHHYNRIPMGKIIYLTGCMNVQELYNNWCDRNGVPNEPIHRMIMIPFAVSQSDISVRLQKKRIEEPVYDETHIPEKLFLCWNRRFRPHRTNLALALEKEGLIDKSYYSMNLVDPEMNSVHFKNTVDVYSNNLLGLNTEVVDRFISKLPLVIDGETDIARMCGDFDRAAKNFYKNSLVSIITETNYDLKELTATEKTWKPAKEKHPFILVGVPGALRVLQDFGFQTFDEFWDESYDEEPDPRIRLYKIVQVCKKIGSWTTEEILDFKRRVKPIVEHNYNVLCNTNTAKVAATKIRTEMNKRLQ